MLFIFTSDAGEERLTLINPLKKHWIRAQKFRIESLTQLVEIGAICARAGDHS